MNNSRRNFLKTSAAIGAAMTGLSPKKAVAADGILSDERMGVLGEALIVLERELDLRLRLAGLEVAHLVV